MHENLFDMNHQFLHRSLMGSVKATCLGRRSGEDWCEVDYTFTRKAGRPNVGESVIRNVMSNPGGKGDLMTIRTSYPYQSLRVWVTSIITFAAVTTSLVDWSTGFLPGGQYSLLKRIQAQNPAVPN